MNITPTTIHKANCMATKIAVYSVNEQRLVLLFKSITLCVNYLFHGKIFNESDRSSFFYLVQKCSQKKETEDKNYFSTLFTYRYIAYAKLLEVLDDQDYIILDERFRNIEYEEKVFHKQRIGSSKQEYLLEKILHVGDIVKIRFGKLTGYTTAIVAIENKRSHTPGTKYYTLDINGAKHKYKANILSLVQTKMAALIDELTIDDEKPN